MEPPAPDLADTVVHQAERALAADLRVSVDQAALILRARAERRGLSLHVVADEVLDPLTALEDPSIVGSR